MYSEIPKIDRTPERIDPILERLAAVWKKMPYLRLGQLLLDAVPNPSRLFYLEDETLMREIENFEATINKRYEGEVFND